MCAYLVHLSKLDNINILSPQWCHGFWPKLTFSHASFWMCYLLNKLLQCFLVPLIKNIHWASTSPTSFTSFTKWISKCSWGFQIMMWEITFERKPSPKAFLFPRWQISFCLHPWSKSNKWSMPTCKWTPSLLVLSNLK